jgi:hypothetical protein
MTHGTMGKKERKTCIRYTDVLEPQTKVVKKWNTVSVHQSIDNLG